MPKSQSDKEAGAGRSIRVPDAVYKELVKRQTDRLTLTNVKPALGDLVAELVFGLAKGRKAS